MIISSTLGPLILAIELIHIKDLRTIPGIEANYCLFSSQGLQTNERVIKMVEKCMKKL